MPKRIYILLLMLISLGASAQTDGERIYTEENPLVYEDCRDLWPYAFLNEEGKPEGYNIALVDRLMSDLNIPYVIKLKPRLETFRDLKEGKADLTLGPSRCLPKAWLPRRVSPWKSSLSATLASLVSR